jgi:CRP-like cAMP-binding protein
MYVLVEGEVEVRAHGDTGQPDRLICTLSAPAYFGEIGVIERIPRTATVTTLTPCQCARIEGADLLEALSITGSAVSLVSAAQARLTTTRPSREAEVDLTATPQIDLTEVTSLTSGAGENLVGGA